MNKTKKEKQGKKLTQRETTAWKQTTESQNEQTSKQNKTTNIQNIKDYHSNNMVVLTD